MKNILKGCAAFFSVLFSLTVFANTALSPVGYWKTIDDVSGKAKAVLRIYESHGVLNGQVVKTFPVPGEKPHTLCTACSGSRHNQPILGMVVLEGLKPSKDYSAQWTGGQILDPLNGKIYRCTVTLMNKGQKLNVRGYIGISLFGRTQTWERVG